MSCLPVFWMVWSHGRRQRPFFQPPVEGPTGILPSPPLRRGPLFQNGARPVGGSSLLWLPCLALVARATHGRERLRGSAATRKSQGSPKSEGEDPKVLTRKIKKAETAAELLGALHGEVDSATFNEFHASAACTKLARWKLGPGDVKNPTLQRLIDRIQVLIEGGRLDPQGLANILWAFAKLFIEVPKVCFVVPALAKAVGQVLWDHLASFARNLCSYCRQGLPHHWGDILQLGCRQ